MTNNFTAIKAGDHVVLEYSGSPITRSHRRIETVAKVTPTQIVLASNTGVGRMGRYRRMDGRPIGGGYLWPWITGIATPKQIAAYEAEQAAKAKESREHRERQNAVDEKERELANLFTRSSYKPVVRLDGDKYDDDKFEVRFTLTARQVQMLAATLNERRRA